MGIVGRTFAVSAVIAVGLCGSSYAEDEPAASFSAPHGFSLPGTHSYLGLSLGRALTANCPATLLFCESRDRSAQMYAGTMFSRHFGAEVGFVDTGKFAHAMGEARAQGLSVSLVGRAQLAPSVGVFGKVGTAYARSDTSVMGNVGASGPEQGFGLAWGGGVSYDVTPRLSATFEYGSYDLRVTGGPVRSTNLGLQFRY